MYRPAGIPHKPALAHREIISWNNRNTCMHINR